MRTKPLPFRVNKAAAVATALAIAASLGAPAVLAADENGPAAPRNLVLTPGRTTADGNVELDWEASTSSDVVAYEVHRAYESTSRPRADETTYLATTTDLWAADLLVVVGRYRYAVVAVDADGRRSAPTPWRQVLYDDPANGAEVAVDAEGPAAPTDLAAEPAYTKDGAVSLSWTAPEADDLARYLVYRAAGDAEAVFVGYVEAGVTYFDDQLTEDGTYNYTVVAQDRAGNLSRRAAPVAVTMDTVAPAVAIRTPKADEVYRPEGSLAVRIKVEDEGSGYDADAVAYFLDGALPDSPVIPLADLAEGEHRLEVDVTDRAGNVGTAAVTFTVEGRAVYDAPVMVTKSAATSSRTVSFEWEAPDKEGVTGYNVYRAEGDGEFVLLGTTAATDRDYTDTVPGEGVWSYHVTARYGRAASEPSAAVVFTVDQTKPTIRISSPEDGGEYVAEGEVEVSYKVRDALAGVARDAVVVKLDGAPLAQSTINLARLAEGEHVLSVTAADRAGNAASATVTFTVVAAPDDEEDDGGEAPARDEAFRQRVLSVLAKWQSKIHHGQFTALKAKAANGNWFAFVKHVQKFSGKFIHPDAAEELLDLFDRADDKGRADHDRYDDDDAGDDDEDDEDDDDDDDDREWKPGNGKKNGHEKKSNQGVKSGKGWK
ncbi:hypothetical protein [Symbiobacterium terraclitae]|uniref:hypothetical protein n=1 Tax=Symbiobacterium terraclitae TaxID=557451 RepID=UPI0035B56727